MDLITEFEGTEGVTRENFNKRIQEANEHISNTNNPHGTTAEQLGAITSATFGGEEVTKDGTQLQIPMPSVEDIWNNSNNNDYFFKVYGLNSINIDTTGDSAIRGNWVVPISETGHGTLPTSDNWHLVWQIDTGHFLRQFATTQMLGTDMVYTRRRYDRDSSWTAWKNTADGGTASDTTSISSAITVSTSEPSTVGAAGTLWGVTT